MSTNTDIHSEHETRASEHHETHHFKVNKTRVTTTADRLTGQEIIALAINEHVPGVEPTDLLELRKDGKKIPITPTESVEIEDDMQFITYPGGKDS